MTEAQIVYWRNVGVGSALLSRDAGEPTGNDDERWGGMMVEMAEGMHSHPCGQPDGVCEVCELTGALWHESYAELPRYVRMSVCRALIRCDIPFPPRPVGVPAS